MQSVFVRGFDSIYLRLLSARGQYLSRVLPSLGDFGPCDIDPCPPIELASLARHLLARYRLLLVGYEGRGTGGTVAGGTVEVHVDPRELRPGATVEWRRVDALYVLGNGPDIQSLAT